MHLKSTWIQIICCLLVWGVVPSTACAQDNGIKFESGLSWNEIQAKARAENKYIFLDCYTTCCGPCKYMNNNIFRQKEAGDYFNARFINVAVQFDSTAKDSRSVRDWYPVAKAISSQYEIQSYPTYLFFSPEGLIIHRVVGSTKTLNEFIGYGENALNPDKQYYTMINRLKEHKGDSVFLRNLLINALKISDKENITSIGEAYMESVNNLFTCDNIRLIARLLELDNSSNNLVFKLFENNVVGINTLMNDSTYVQWELGRIIFSEELTPLFEKGIFPIDWKKMRTTINLKYPLLGQTLVDIVLKDGFTYYVHDLIWTDHNENKIKSCDWNRVVIKIKKEIIGFDLEQILAEEQARFYASKNSWSNCIDACFSLLKKYGDKVGQREINNISYDYLFKHCNESKILDESIKWMKYYIDLDSNRQENMDTYANLLYKIGQKSAAIKWEKRTIALAEQNKFFPEDIKEFQATLNKMENGIPTWTTKK